MDSPSFSGPFCSQGELKNFLERLKTWQDEGQWGEDRVETAQVLREAFEQKKTTLNLFSKNLTSLPDVFDSLAQLQDIDLTFNQLSELPPSFFTLKELKSLSLLGNKFERLPDTLSKLVTLENLNLGDNQLRSLPVKIGDLENLKAISLAGNTNCVLPFSFLKMGLSSCDVDLYSIGAAISTRVDEERFDNLLLSEFQRILKFELDLKKPQVQGFLGIGRQDLKSLIENFLHIDPLIFTVKQLRALFGL